MTKATMDAAKKAFVKALQEAKSALALNGRDRGTKGSNKALATSIGVSPDRIGDFFNPEFEPDDIGNPAHLRKAIAGFASSVERAVSWLEKERLASVNSLEVESIVRSYWSNKIDDDILRSIGTSFGAAEQNKSISVELRIGAWGTGRNKTKDELAHSFLVNYGKAVFQQINPLETKFSIEPRELDDVLKGLPLRAQGGNWAVAVGTYDLLDRRFRGLDFIRFPALRYPMVGLIASKKRLPDEIGTLSFSSPALEYSENTTRSILTAELTYPRFVAPEDASSRVALYSLLPDDKGEPQGGHEATTSILPASTKLSVARRLMNEIEKLKGPVVFLGDGQLVFEVFADLIKHDFHVRVLGQHIDRPIFSFQCGIMFRDDAHLLQTHLEEAQYQLFRTTWRVVDLLKTYLKEVDEWISMHSTDRVQAEWLKQAPNVPVFVYPYVEMAAYLNRAHWGGSSADIHWGDRSLAASDAASVYDRLAEFCQGLRNSHLMRALFKKQVGHHDALSKS